MSPDHLTSPVTLRESGRRCRPGNPHLGCALFDRPAGRRNAAWLGGSRDAGFSVPGRPGILEVPIGAINERGEGPQVWQIVDGQAEPVPVELLAMDTETAPDSRGPARRRSGSSALGTHLLETRDATFGR